MMIWPERMRVSLILNVMLARFKAVHMLYEPQTRKAPSRPPTANSNGIFRESVIEVSFRM